MRHLWSLLAGVVAAPLTWLFLSIGQHRSQRVVERWDQTGWFDTADLIGPAIFLVVAGILLGLIGTLRWSPAGAVAAGLLFVIPTVLMFISPFRTLEGFFRPDDGAPRRFLGQDLQPWLPVENGTLLVLGSLLLIAVFSAQRWRRWPILPTPRPPATDDEVVAGISEISALSARPEADTADTGAGPATAPGTAPGTDSDTDSGTEDPDRRTMTDDEILATAAAYEASEPPPAAPPESPPSPASEEPAEPDKPARPSNSGSSGSP